ncbi:AraC family transcriptional regulator [Paenibacillus sp. P96]|uniref:AraC family transcriptional regulator n=1 Tax=Paenibacillus zeirhizosphaerae TaxID=2987519 RepID=A0ABT9FSY0_9BACL|nr:AraC family transcriptional regulator [Paenibacillus sp. P96]MDP4097848.1 AraC family transcriptional regulator [Paenibacillus sp. P96]
MKKGVMFYKIFIPILVLGIGLVTSFEIYIYYHTMNSVVDRVADSKESYITQIKNNLEQKIQTIEYAFNTFSTTPFFNEVVANPITEKDFVAYRNINSQLNYIASMGLEGATYTLISLDQKWQVSNGSLSHLEQDDLNRLYEDYINKQDQSLFWIRTDTGIRFVNTLPVFSKKKQAIALSDISLGTLNRMIKTGEQPAVLIVNKQGDLMYETDPGASLLTDAQRRSISRTVATQQDTGMFSLDRPDDAPLKVLYAKSAYNNWTYITLLDQKEVNDALKMTRFGLITMGLLLILLIAVVAYAISIYFTKPILRIKRSLPEGHHLTSKNEIDWIINSIDSIVTEKKSLETLVQSELPQLETQLVLNLFRNRVTKEELERKLPRFGYDILGNRVYVTMLVQLDNIGKREASDKDVLLLAVNKVVEEVIPEERRLLPIILNDDTQATIVAFSEANAQEIRREVLEYASTMIRTVKEYLQCSISIGISKSYENLLLSKEACEMSKQALHHRLNLGKESIIFYEDITKVVSGPVLLHYPAQLETQLFDAIRLGDEGQVARALYPLLAELMKHNKNAVHLEVMLVRLVNNLIQLEQVLGIEVLMTHDNHALYQRVLSIRNPEEVERLLVEQVIFPMVRSMKEKTNQQFRSLSEKIAAIVRAEYDRELSLEMIGDRLHYNPNYLSSIFKKEFGTTFSDYLMNYRLDMAKKWLIDTDMTIKEIAERLQYQNPQNFIRSFRKKENVTPGAYRKMKQAN